MSEQKCQTVMQQIHIHAGIVERADAVLVEEMRILSEEKAVAGNKARADGSAASRAEKQALIGFTNTPQHLPHWLIKSNTLQVRVEGRPLGR